MIYYMVDTGLLSAKGSKSLFMVCKHTYQVSYTRNMKRMFCGKTPTKCYATTTIRNIFSNINSRIPICSVSNLCVVGTVDDVDTCNSVCVVGSICDVLTYFVGMLEEGFGFSKIEVYPQSKHVGMHAHGRRRQYVTTGFGDYKLLGITNIVDLR